MKAYQPDLEQISILGLELDVSLAGDECCDPGHIILLLSQLHKELSMRIAINSHSAHTTVVFALVGVEKASDEEKISAPL